MPYVWTKTNSASKKKKGTQITQKLQTGTKNKLLI